MHCPVQQLYITMYTLNLPYLTHLTMSHLPPLPHQISTLPATLATLKLNIVRAAPFYNKGGSREERMVVAVAVGERLPATETLLHFHPLPTRQ